MVEKFISASADYLKFTFGVMLPATAGFFLYACFVTGGADHAQSLTVVNTMEITVALVLATKILTGVFFPGDRLRREWC